VLLRCGDIKAFSPLSGPVAHFFFAFAWFILLVVLGSNVMEDAMVVVQHQGFFLAFEAIVCWLCQSLKPRVRASGLSFCGGDSHVLLLGSHAQRRNDAACRSTCRYINDRTR